MNDFTKDELETLSINGTKLVEWLTECKTIAKRTRTDFEQIGDKEMSMMQLGKYNGYEDVLRYIKALTEQENAE